MSTTRPACEVLDQCHLEVRAKLLELAALLDRIERADDFESASADARLVQFRESLDILTDRGFDRAERIQMVFSDPYEPGWQRPRRRPARAK